MNMLRARPPGSFEPWRREEKGATKQLTKNLSDPK